MKEDKSNRLKNWIQIRHLNVFVLLLFLSLIVSVLTNLSNYTTQTFKVELVPTNLQKEELLTQNEPKFISVDVSAQGFSLLKFVFKDLKLNVDFSNLRKDQNYHYWDQDSQKSSLYKVFGKDLEIKNIAPSVVKFKYDKQSVKRVLVKINSNISFATGFDFTNRLKPYPDSIDLIGPKKLIDPIESVSTILLELMDLKSDINQSIGLQALENIKFSKDQVSLKGQVERFTEGEISLPLNIINLPENYTISTFPHKIDLIFYTSLSSFNSVSTSDFRVECDFNDIDLANNILIPRLVFKSDKIKSASLMVSKLQYILNKNEN